MITINSLHSYICRCSWQVLLAAVLCLWADMTLAGASALQSGESNGHATPLFKPGFNCAKGHSKNEQMICSDSELARIDYALNLLYTQAKLATHNSAAFKKTNNEEWLWREQHCHDRDCLLQWYANRHAQLMNVLTAHKPAKTSVSSSAPNHISISTATSALVSVPAASPTLNTDETTAPATDQSDNHSAPSAATNTTQQISQTLITFPVISSPFFWMIAIGSVIVVFFFWEMLGTDGQVRKRARLITAAVKSNVAELATQQAQWVAGESSGMHDPKRWDKEKRRFIEEMVKPALTDCAPLSMTEVDRLCLILDYMVWDVLHEKISYKFRGRLDETHRSDYLHFCARILKEREWKVRALHINKPDAHLIATRKTMIIVAVCKPQSVPVGSESMREAHELQSKYQARKAVVVSNAPFTTAAQKDAEQSKALLVHHFDLSLLASMAEL